MEDRNTTPAAGTADVLNEKDLHCIARHISQHVEDSKYETTADFGGACMECSYALTDTCSENSGHLNPWPTFKKLSRATNVNISPLMKR